MKPPDLLTICPVCEDAKCPKCSRCAFCEGHVSVYLEPCPERPPPLEDLNETP